MPESFAYHSVVHALEGDTGWTPERRFASGVLHAIDGHLPYARFVAAGLARQHEGISAAVVAQRVREWLAADVNPLIVFFCSLRSPEQLSTAFLAYQETCGGEPATSVPPPCRSSTDAWGAAMLGPGRVTPLRSVTALAARLGLAGSAAAHVAEVFEREGSMPVADVASTLGCQRRTLERQLQRMEISAEAIRQACRLMHATSMLESATTLTQVAVQAGYADTAHMSRAFRAAVRMTPSMMRRLSRDAPAHAGLPPATGIFPTAVATPDHP